MDLELEYDNDREMEDIGMILKVDEFEIEVSEKYIEERKELFGYHSNEENIYDIKNLLRGYLACFTEEEKKDEEFTAKVNDWLDGELDIFRSNISIQFDPTVGFEKMMNIKEGD